MSRFRLRVGDFVEVIAGKDKGKRGAIKEVDRDSGKVKVGDVALRTKFFKRSMQRESGIQKIEAFIAVSNVMLVDPTTDKVDKISAKFVDGKKVRIYRTSGAEVATPILRKKAKEVN